MGEVSEETITHRCSCLILSSSLGNSAESNAGKHFVQCADTSAHSPPSK